MIVESPTKSKTISNFLGRDFNVVSSMGHVRDLPKKKFGVDIENSFKPHYVLDPEKRRLVSQIVEKAKESDKIFLASDNDREGEAIAWHLKEILKEKDIPEDSIYRIVFNEITKDAILNSLQSLGQIDIKKVDAQQARRILDRIVGYKVSPILWKVIAKNLSAGRVQTVAMRLICEREEEIKNFVPEEYWTIEAELKKDDTIFTAKLEKYKDENVKLKTLSDADKLYNELRDKRFFVLSVETGEKKVAPYPPFITSTLQQEASKILGFSTKKTMRVAQQLYEGVPIEGKNTGLITYMRTDSVRISEKANFELKKLIKEEFPDEYSISYIRKYANKNKAQDAHEAIRPTSTFYIPDKIKKFLTKDQHSLYRLIWERFVATQMQSAKIEDVKATIKAGDGLFGAESHTIKFDGFFKVYPYPSSQYKANSLPKLQPEDEVELINLHKNQHTTKPPARYTEASLVKKLEKEGIGRPSTYAPIISTLLDRGYVNLVKRYFHPTELGTQVEKFLIEKFPDFFAVPFTANLENRLDQIEQGKENWQKVLTEYYKAFLKELEKIDIKEEKNNFIELSNEKCEKCGSPMIVKYGKYGKYLACSAFPKCKNTKPILDEETKKIVEASNEKCPECGGNLELKSGRFGRFFACENYPKCKFTKPFSTGLPCPECDGEIVERKSKKGRKFYGCSNYPKCKFITNYKPVRMECPDCHTDIMFEKNTKTSSKLICLKCKKELVR